MAIKKTSTKEVTPEVQSPVEDVVTDGFLPEEPSMPAEHDAPTQNETNDVNTAIPPSFNAVASIVKGNDPVTVVQNTSIASSTEYQLANGEFVSRYYPLFDTEEPGAKACVTINGVPYWFEKGKEIKIPSAVAAIYDITVERKMVGSDRARAMLANRSDFVSAFN